MDTAKEQAKKPSNISLAVVSVGYLLFLTVYTFVFSALYLVPIISQFVFTVIALASSGDPLTFLGAFVGTFVVGFMIFFPFHGMYYSVLIFINATLNAIVVPPQRPWFLLISMVSAFIPSAVFITGGVIFMTAEYEGPLFELSLWLMTIGILLAILGIIARMTVRMITSFLLL